MMSKTPTLLLCHAASIFDIYIIDIYFFLMILPLDYNIYEYIDTFIYICTTIIIIITMTLTPILRADI